MEIMLIQQTPTSRVSCVYFYKGMAYLVSERLCIFKQLRNRGLALF